MNYLLLIIFGLTPSIIWLLYFLRKDVHPEDNRQVIKIFLYGALAVLPTALLQLGIFKLFSFLNPSVFKTALIIFLVVAPTEEFLKYLVVRDKIMKSPHLDEPTDLPLYMIISSLGFAAIENIMVILGLGIPSLSIARTAVLSLFRFLSATFLHVLASGTLGIFLAASCFQPKAKTKLLAIGFALAIVLHGLYNFSIMVIEGNARFLIPFIIIINLAIVLSLGFKKLKDLKSVCKII